MRFDSVAADSGVGHISYASLAKPPVRPRAGHENL
jgi:hypothetical protein